MADGGEYKKAAKWLQARIKTLPQVGVVCGSGLSGLSKAMTDTQVFNYNDIPGFPKTHVAGHVGELVFGLLAGVPTVCMRGRFHFYEGHSMQKVVMGIRVMRCLGVKVAIMTNAAGGLNPAFNVGDVMCIMDHFALPMMTGTNPLMGPNDDSLGPRFLPTSNAYTEELKEIVVQAGKTLSFDFIRPHGVYGLVTGPNYESPTEARFLRSMGVDAVGMSTIPEIIAAHHCGIKCIGLSLICNKVILPGETGTHVNHNDVLDVAEMRQVQMQALVKEIVNGLKSELEKMADLPKIDLGSTKAIKKTIATKKPAKAMKKASTAKRKPAKVMKKVMKR